jgi:hypothetical protein
MRVNPVHMPPALVSCRRQQGVAIVEAAPHADILLWEGRFGEV